MPCRSYEDDNYIPAPPTTRHGMTIDDFEAVLCGVFSQLLKEGRLKDFTTSMDWKEIGVPWYKVEGWWVKHVAEDEARRERENEAKRKQQLRESALSKLTAEERDVLLGVK